MKVRTTVIGAVLAVVAAGALIISSAGSASSEQDSFLAGVVSDVGRFNDKGFNQLSLKGCKSGARKSGERVGRSSPARRRTTFRTSRGSSVTARTSRSRPASCWRRAPRPSRSGLADAKFTIVDYSVKAPPFANAKGKVLSKNVVGLTFATNQNSYMIGCLAALMAKRDGGTMISAVGGIKIPTVDIFIAAYRAGARKCVPGTQTLIDYSQEFVDQAKCSELATNQIDRGSKVVFAVAGGCGLGALDVAKEAGVWGVGVDNDQSFLGRHILTSAVKRVDVAVETAVLSAKNGTFKGGTDLNFNLKNKGVAVGKINSRVPKAFITRMNAIGAQILAGKIKPPTKV